MAASFSSTEVRLLHAEGSCWMEGAMGAKLLSLSQLFIVGILKTCVHKAIHSCALTHPGVLEMHLDQLACPYSASHSLD